MRTEIRGYLFSIRMFQVRQASDEGGEEGRRKIKEKPTEVRTREEEEEEEGGGKRGGRGSVAVSLLHITEIYAESIFVLERISKCILCRERERRTRTHTHTHRGDQTMYRTDTF